MALTFDLHRNFAVSLITSAPVPATSGTSLVVSGGDGAKFPAPPFDATVWPVNVAASTANAEIVRVTGVSTDTFTIVRAQESSNPRSIGTGDQIAATITVKTLTDVETMTAPTVVTIAGSYAVLATDDVILMSLGGTTATLITAVGRLRPYNVKNTSSGNVTVATSLSQTIDNASTFTLYPLDSITLISDQSNWWIL